MPTSLMCSDVGILVGFGALLVVLKSILFGSHEFCVDFSYHNVYNFSIASGISFEMLFGSIKQNEEGGRSLNVLWI